MRETGRIVAARNTGGKRISLFGPFSQLKIYKILDKFPVFG
jgi:hypothetical protein